MIHKRKDKHKSWIDDASAQMGAKISSELTQLVAIHGEETPQLRLQAYVNAKGIEPSGKVHGYGDVTPDTVQWVHQNQPASSIRRSRKGRVYASLESDFLVLQSKYEQQQEVNEKQKKDIEELRQIILSSRQQSLNSQPENCPLENRSSSLHHSLHSQTEQSPTRHQSPTQHQSSSQSLSYHRSPSRPVTSSLQYPPNYAQPPLYHYPLSSQFYYPQPYCQPLYPGYHPHGEFTTMLNDPDFMQRFMQSDKRNDQHA